MKPVEEIVLGEFIELCESIAHLYKVEGDKVNIIANIYLQKWLFFNKDKIFESMSEHEIINAISESARYEIQSNEFASNIEYRENEDIEFQNDLWRIVPPTYSNDLEGFERSQQIALILSDLQDNQPSALAELCCVYLVRLRGEGEEKKLTLELSKQLPLSIVFKVKKYVNNSIEIYNFLDAYRIPAVGI